MAKKTIDRKIKVDDPVAVRFAELPDGRKSVYLDYRVNGKRKREYLRLYLVPVKRKQDKTINDRVMQMVMARKGKRLQELQDEWAALAMTDDDAKAVRFCSYVEKLCRSEPVSRATKQNYQQVSKLIGQYYTDRVTFRRIDRHFIADFVEKLKTHESTYRFTDENRGARLCGNTIVAIYSAFRSILGKAYRDGIIQSNPASEYSISSQVKKEFSPRVYLEIDELKAFAKVKTSFEAEQQAFVFSCLCGLRISDIRALTWRDIKKTKEGYRISIEMVKTRRRLEIPLSDEAYNWLPTKPKTARPTDKVFHLVAQQYVIDRVRSIAGMAGISKHVTFHSARHTHATMMLTLGADLYTVSKLLGHNRVTTTQIYGDIIDQKKREAVNLIPDFIHDDRY